MKLGIHRNPISPAFEQPFQSERLDGFNRGDVGRVRCKYSFTDEISGAIKVINDETQPIL